MALTRLLFVPVLLFTALAGCAHITVPLQLRNLPLEEQVIEGEGSAKLLLLDISGTISEKERSGGLLAGTSPSLVSQVREALHRAEQDDAVAGLILRINSPGGTVTASDTIYHEVQSFRNRRKIPVSACITGIGTSGGYYVAAAADEIVAHPTSITGSIGVLLLTFNLEGLLAKVGVSEETIKSGPRKDILSPFRPATGEERQLVQTIIDRLYGRFLDVVSARPGGKLDRTQLLKLADGSIYTADQALAAGLIDRVGYLDDVIGGLKKRLDLDSARVVTYVRPGSHAGSIYAESTTEATFVGELAGLLGGAAARSGEAGFLYLWAP